MGQAFFYSVLARFKMDRQQFRMYFKRKPCQYEEFD